MAKRFIWLVTVVSLTIMSLAIALPVLAASFTFSWVDRIWSPGGSLSQTYTNVGNPARDLNFTFSGNTGNFVAGSPLIANYITGGFEEEVNLFFAVDFTDTSQSVTLTIDFSEAVRNVSFTVMDLDVFTNNNIPVAIDEIVVTGARPGDNNLLPTLTATDTNCVTVTGNVATGICDQVGNNVNNGNVLVNFATHLDSISILYRDGPGSPSNPDAHGIALHNITFTPSTPTAISLQSTGISTSGPAAVYYFLVGGSILTFVTIRVLARFRRVS